MESRSQVDRLGDRLRIGEVTAASLRELEGFRASFAAAYGHVETVLTTKLRLKVTGRPSKSAVSIIEKLRRESTRLSQIQDIAGCRVVVRDIEAQDLVCAAISIFLGARVYDRRDQSSYGYRAVHLVARHNGLAVEIQVRTSLQHAWAELSEKISDSYGQEIKYGGGVSWAQDFLGALAKRVEEIERLREELKKVQTQIKDALRKSAKRRALKLQDATLNRQARESISAIQLLFHSISDK